MREGYILEYENENEFKKLESSVKKYNMLAYKKLIFEYYPELKDGNFLGKLVSVNTKEFRKNYELKLPTDDLFIKVHGEVTLCYTVCMDTRVVVLKSIKPESLLIEGHRQELKAYKGVMISSANSIKDKFKIDLLTMIEK